MRTTNLFDAQLRLRAQRNARRRAWARLWKKLSLAAMAVTGLLFGLFVSFTLTTAARSAERVPVAAVSAGAALPGQ
jgi:hypothetical protein